MNKKIWVLIVVFAMLLVLPACKKKAPGQVNQEAMLAMVPDGAIMLLSFDFLKFSDLTFFDKILKDDWKKDSGPGAVFADYPDFVQKTGIDLKKDVYTVTAGIYGELGGVKPQMVAFVNLRYDKEKVLALLRQNNVIVAEDNYRGLGLYTLKGEESFKDGLRTLSKEDSQKEARLVFLNTSNIIIGTEAQVKLAVDLAQGSGASILKNAAMMKYVDKLDKKSMFWLAIGNIPDKYKNAPAGGMMPVDLSKAEAFTAVTDFKNNVLSGELRLISNDEAGNKQIVDMLNGLKALGSMGSEKEPELGQLLNGIQLSSTADAITLTFSLSEELMNKLGDKAKDKAKTMVPETESEPETDQ